jgi:hypothetical protein
MRGLTPSPSCSKTRGMRPARSAFVGLVFVVGALLACKKNRPLTLSTPSNQPVPPGDGGDAGPAASHKQINADTYSVECFGSNIDCVKEAATVCQKGYDVLASSEGAPAPPPEAGSPAATPDAAAPPVAADAGAPADDAAAPAAGLQRIEMVVRCKK